MISFCKMDTFEQNQNDYFAAVDLTRWILTLSTKHNLSLLHNKTLSCLHQQ